MHAELSPPDDPHAAARLSAALATLGAVLVEQDVQVGGIEVLRYRIGSEDCILHRDAGAVDVEGSEEVVGRIREAMAVGGGSIGSR